MAANENAVMYAVEQVCGLYGVQATREQSRQFNVQGAAGRWRPMFFGTWTDELGKKHFKGKPDFLLRPRVPAYALTGDEAGVHRFISVPLWVECKSATGKASVDQMAFASWVTKNGDHYLLLREDVRPLIAWFDQHGVEKHCDEVALATVVTPLDASELYNLACKWCGLSRAEHTTPALGCTAGKGQLLGKVWSPDLRKGVQQGT